jgi:hypothetical protein
MDAELLEGMGAWGSRERNFEDRFELNECVGVEEPGTERDSEIEWPGLLLLTCETHNSDSDLALLLDLPVGPSLYLCSNSLLFFLLHSCHPPWQYNQSRHLHSSSPHWVMPSRGPLVDASVMRTCKFYT